MTTNLDPAALDHALDDILDGTTATDAGAATADDAAAEPYVDALPIDLLFADHTYQRELDQHRVTKMAAAFRIALVGIIEVSARPDGRYAILDGQHRWATVRDVDFGRPRVRHLPCRVHTGLTPTDEASLYHQLNTTRKQLTGWDRWLARRAAAEPLVLDIEACAARHGYTINMREAPAVIRATKACENVVTLGSVGLLDEVLDVLRATYGDDQTGLDSAIIHGLAHVLHAYDRDELELVRLIEALTGVVPRQLTARAAAVRELHQGTTDRLTAHVIVERYNATKGRKIEAFFDRVKPLSKSLTQAERDRRAERERVLAWARETSYDGRTYHQRVTKEMAAAHAAAQTAAESDGAGTDGEPDATEVTP